jgi:signal transduction histidine kinase
VRLVSNGARLPVPCHTDSQRVRQILINLLSNAVRLSPSDETVAVTLTADDHRVRFDVSDRGPGIQPSDLARIFEAFVPGGSSDERGTGLGLTLSRQLAHLLSGDLRVTSQPGAGATFTLELPRGLDQS